MSAELALSVMAITVSLGSLGLTGTLLYRHQKDYASRSDLGRLRDYVTGELARLQGSQSQLYRYVEAVDAQSGGNGHQVLRRRVHRNHPEARER